MHVINRHGDVEPVSFDKILKRLQLLSSGLHPIVDLAAVTQKVISGMCSGITTFALDELAAQTCAALALTHPDYSKLAARLAVDNLHKQTQGFFSQVIETLHGFYDKQGRAASMIHDDVYRFVMDNKDVLNNAIDYSRDFDFDYFGFKTLSRSYLLRTNNVICERPQHLLMRVACGIHYGNIEKTLETYELLSTRYFTHATPTMFNAGTPKPQMSSCFLLSMQDDSIEGIFNTLKQCALISKTAGGIGVSSHCVRATNSYIRGTNGRSNGLVPMLRVFNGTARYVDQGGGKRKGSFAIYLEPWHADIFEFLDLRKNDGVEEARCRDLFFGLWVPDLFMERVESDGLWTLMCPNECPGLFDVYGNEFKTLYEQYEKEGLGRKQIKAMHLWRKIIESQIETGQPYMLYKDACNRKSNQQNLGVIKSSNLCTEIIQYTSPEEIAVCNLSSVALPMFVVTTSATPYFDFQKLYQVVKVVTGNLNKVIDRNYYPVPEAEVSNLRHRPIGIGVQGLADCFILMRFPFESDEARQLNLKIFETIYHAACEKSCELAELEGPYETYEGSPASRGLLQMDLWDLEYRLKHENKEGRLEGVRPPLKQVVLSGLWNWDRLREKIKKYGLRNSLLVAPMPTASTSQILGNNEAFEPYTSNMYNRRTLSGEFCVVNPHLIKDLIELDLWNEEMRMRLIAHNGSVQKIVGIPQNLKNLYKTVWEIKQKTIIDMATDRGPFIDQSQSLNIHLAAPTYAKICAMHFHGWRSGLKTGMYYLRTQPAADPIKFTVDYGMVQEVSTAALQTVNHAEKVMINEEEQKCSKTVARIIRPPISSTAFSEEIPNGGVPKGGAVLCRKTKNLGVLSDSFCEMCSG